jgi:hypothetical protein
MVKLGLVEPNESNCQTCHNKENPTASTDTFKFEDDKVKVHDKTK